MTAVSEMIQRDSTAMADASSPKTLSGLGFGWIDSWAHPHPSPLPSREGGTWPPLSPVSEYGACLATPLDSRLRGNDKDCGVC